MQTRQMRRYVSARPAQTDPWAKPRCAAQPSTPPICDHSPFPNRIIEVELFLPAWHVAFKEMNNPLMVLAGYLDNDITIFNKILSIRISILGVERINVLTLAHFFGLCPQDIHRRPRHILFRPYRRVGTALFHAGCMFLCEYRNSHKQQNDQNQNAFHLDLPSL